MAETIIVASSSAEERGRKLIQEHLALARSLARQFNRGGIGRTVELDDLIGCAYLGLCDAARRFDPTKNQHFKTYAYFRIRGAMIDFVRNQAPRKRSSLQKQIERSSPSVLEVSYPFATTISELMQLVETIDALGIHLHYDHENRDIDLSYRDGLTPEDYTGLQQTQQFLRKLIQALPEEQREIVELRYFDGHTLEEIGEQLTHLSRSTLVRYHSNALESIRKGIVERYRVCAERVLEVQAI